jgi:hypothetical protein
VHSEFYTPAQKEFILVSLDFPQGDEAKAAVPNPARNEELMNKYGVAGFPTVMIVEADGTALGQTGYQDMDPADYFADVQRIRDAGKKAMIAIKELQAELETAEDKLAVTMKAAAMLGDMENGTPGVNTVADIARQGLSLTEDTAVQIELLNAVLLVVSPSPSDRELAAKLDPSNEHGLMSLMLIDQMNTLGSIEDVASFAEQAEVVFATGNMKADEDTLVILVSCAFFYKEYLADEDKAKVWAQRAKDQGGLDERMEEVIDQILGTSPFEEDPEF